MRINPNQMPDLLAALNQSKLITQEAEMQIATGRRVNVPSDDPTAASLLVQNNDQATFNAGYLQSLGALQGQLSTADSTLGSVVTALQQAETLGIEGANGTLSDADRAAITMELQGIQSQVMSLANTSYEGVYLFAGTITNTAPFVVNNNIPSGVGYVGNNGVNQVLIGNGYQLAANVPGSQLFSASGNDVFLALNNLILAMQGDSGIEDAVGQLSTAASYLSAQRVFYGNALSQAQSQTTYLNSAKLQITQEQNTLAAADMAQAATNLSQSQLDTQATLAAISKFTQNNLFDYIR
ncbi:MAG TPA: flagellar hook-associated protein FlgL [Terriglobales bacterium]|nr:flagellar hook-associated protein FlgL [Terriglobales bacterium]